MELTAVLNSTIKLFTTIANYLKPKPTFKVRKKHNSSKKGYNLVFDFDIQNTSKVAAHNVVCLVSAIEPETDKGVVNPENNRLFK